MSEEAVIKYINAPLTEETVKDLHAGDVVRISGYIYTARDAAHKRCMKRWSAAKSCLWT